jgi:hypothetical protein
MFCPNVEKSRETVIKQGHIAVAYHDDMYTRMNDLKCIEMYQSPREVTLDFGWEILGKMIGLYFMLLQVRVIVKLLQEKGSEAAKELEDVPIYTLHCAMKLLVNNNGLGPLVPLCKYASSGVEGWLCRPMHVDVGWSLCCCESSVVI